MSRPNTLLSEYPARRAPLQDENIQQELLKSAVMDLFFCFSLSFVVVSPIY